MNLNMPKEKSVILPEEWFAICSFTILILLTLDIYLTSIITMLITVILSARKKKNKNI